MRGLLCTAGVPRLFNTRDWFPLRQLFHRPDRGDGFGMIQACYFYGALHFYYYYVSSTSDHQVLDPGGWGCLAQSISVTLPSGYTLESPKL